MQVTRGDEARGQLRDFVLLLFNDGVEDVHSIIMRLASRIMPK
jgi:hypothetical protein